jgi:hypothetical protein
MLFSFSFDDDWLLLVVTHPSSFLGTSNSDLICEPSVGSVRDVSEKCASILNEIRTRYHSFYDFYSNDETFLSMINHAVLEVRHANLEKLLHSLNKVAPLAIQVRLQMDSLNVLFDVSEIIDGVKHAMKDVADKSLDRNRLHFLRSFQRDYRTVFVSWAEQDGIAMAMVDHLMELQSYNPVLFKVWMEDASFRDAILSNDIAKVPSSVICSNASSLLTPNQLLHLLQEQKKDDAEG